MERISVGFTPEEKEKLKDAAKKLDVPLAKLIRDRVLKTGLPGEDEIDYSKTMRVILTLPAQIVDEMDTVRAGYDMTRSQYITFLLVQGSAPVVITNNYDFEDNLLEELYASLRNISLVKEVAVKDQTLYQADLDAATIDLQDAVESLRKLIVKIDAKRNAEVKAQNDKLMRRGSDDAEGRKKDVMRQEKTSR